MDKKVVNIPVPCECHWLEFRPVLKLHMWRSKGRQVGSFHFFKQFSNEARRLKARLEKANKMLPLFVQPAWPARPLSMALPIAYAAPGPTIALGLKTRASSDTDGITDALPPSIHLTRTQAQPLRILCSTSRPE